MDHPVSDALSTDQQEPPKKKQKLGGTIDDILVPVESRLSNSFSQAWFSRPPASLTNPKATQFHQPTVRRFRRASIPIATKPK